MTLQLDPPAGDPTTRRKFQYTDLVGNNNKFYLVETWDLGRGRVHFRATYGRVGAAKPQSNSKIVSPDWVAAQIGEKLDKGYQEVALARPVLASAFTEAAPAATLPTGVGPLIDWIFREAGERIAGYLACNVDTLSPAQIARGRDLLDQAQRQFQVWQQARAAAEFRTLAATVQGFYNSIPTQLPHRIDPQEVVLGFCRDFNEQETRLNQLQAALATLVQPGGSAQEEQAARYGLLGVELGLLPPTDPAYAALVERITRTSVHGYRIGVQQIFRVTIPGERTAFGTEIRGKSAVEQLFHGTRNPNVRHILHSGLICPRTPANGRMFGDGIYFADKVSKSANFCGGSAGGPQMFFLADVALGQRWRTRSAQAHLQAPPAGYDSVMGEAGGSLRNNEFIVYQASQQTLQYLVTFERQ